MVTNRRDADAGAGLTLTLLVLEVVHDGVVITRLNRRISVEIISEQNTEAFSPRVAAPRVDVSVAMSTRLINQSSTVPYDAEYLVCVKKLILPAYYRKK